MKLLQAKLYQMEQEKKAAEVDSLKGDKKEISLWEVKSAPMFLHLTLWLRIIELVTK